MSDIEPLRGVAFKASVLAASLVAFIAACGAPTPTGAPDSNTSAPRATPSSAVAPPIVPTPTMRAEAASYGQHYCAALEAWNRAFDGAVDWSTESRLNASAAETPSPAIAAALAIMRTEIAGIATFPPVTPIARALGLTADRLERVVGLIGPVMAVRGPVSGDLEQNLPRLFADLDSAAELHRVAEGTYGRLDCPAGLSERVTDPSGAVSFAIPDGWSRLGPADEREAQLAGIENEAFVARLRQNADAAGPSSIVLYDAADPGLSGLGAVVWSFVDPAATDLLGSVEGIQADLASNALLSEIEVRYLDRPAGDGARLVSRSTDGDLRDQLIVDLVRLNEGIVIVVSVVPEPDASSYRLAIERVLGSLEVAAT